LSLKAPAIVNPNAMATNNIRLNFNLKPMIFSLLCQINGDAESSLLRHVNKKADKKKS